MQQIMNENIMGAIGKLTPSEQKELIGELMKCGGTILQQQSIIDELREINRALKAQVESLNNHVASLRYACHSMAGEIEERNIQLASVKR